MAEEAHQNLMMIRRELESYAQELQELKEPLDQAISKEDPVPVTLAQIRNSLTVMKGLKASILAAQQVLVRQETDEGLAVKDAQHKRHVLKMYAQASEQACCLKAMAEAQQHIKTANREISRLEKGQTENPHKKYSIAIQAAEKHVDAVKASINSADLDDENELWTTLDGLEERLLAVSSQEILPKDIKDAIKKKKSFKVAPLVVPKFSGKLENWITFWAEFNQAIHRDEEMENGTKLVYLKQAMQDPGLKSTLADLGVEDAAYVAAVNLLKERFDQPRMLHRKCCESLKNIPTTNGSRESMTAFADKGQHILTVLTRLGKLGVSEVITSMMEMSMDRSLKHEWMNHTDSMSTTPPVEKLLSFVRRKADQAENEGVTPAWSNNEKGKHQKSNNHKGRGSHVAVTTPTQQPSQPQPNPSVAAVTTPAPANQPRAAPGAARTEYPPCKYSCPLCPMNHYAFFCDVFKSYTPRQRNNHAHTHNLCFSCLKPGHAASECRSIYRCKTCKGQHNSMLHEDPASVASPTVVSTNSAISDNFKLKDTLFMTANVLLTGTNGITTTARAFLDNGAGLSIVSCSMRNTLALRSTGDTVEIDGVGGISVAEASPLVRVTLSTNYKKGWQKDITVAVVPKPARDIPLKQASETKDLTHLQGLVLADNQYYKPGPVDIMLGQDIWDQLFLKGEILGPEGTPSARQTVFGWVVSGLYQPDKTSRAVTACAHYVATAQANKVSDDLLYQFFKIEEPPSPKKEFTAEEKRVEKEYEDTHRYVEEDKRYMVTLPRTPGQLQLGESRKQALNRAASNERSLIRRQRYDAFQAVMAEYIDLGHARPVSPQDMSLAPPSIYYMPVHSVIKESSTSTKVRAVFDASAVTSTKVSFNDLLAVGPTIQPALDQTLLKFRLYPVAISGDVSKMYREILLSPEDRSLHRFMWRATPDNEWTDYEMLRVTFGVTASPYVAIKTLQQAANDFGKGHPEAQSHIKESFYVDDFFAGAATPQEAIKLRQEISDILSQAGFTIKKWRSSSSRVLNSVPAELQESIPSQELVDSHSAHYPKALGLVWDSRKDKMAAKIEVPPTYCATKRGIRRCKDI